MKKIAAFALILILLICSACTDAHLSYSLKDDFAVGSSMSLTICKEEEIYADSILEYWESLGFDTSKEMSEELITITGHNGALYQDMATASADFSSRVTSDDTIFSEAEFEYVPSFEQDAFSFSAVVNLEDMIRQNELQDIPESDLDELLGYAENARCTLTLMMPGEIEETNADDVNGKTCIWNLQYGQTTQILLETVLDNEAAVDEYNELKTNEQSRSMMFRLMVVAAGFLLLLLIIFLILRHVRRRR